MKIKRYLRNNLSKNRYKHTLSVNKTAKMLARKYKVNVKKVSYASLLHDMSKEMNLYEQEKIINNYFKNEDVVKIKSAWHSYTASILSKDIFNIKDESILNAIKYHTLAHPNMDNVAKIVYIADFIEPLRNNIDTEFYFNLIPNFTLDELCLKITVDNINYLKKNNKFIPKQTLDFISKLKKNQD